MKHYIKTFDGKGSSPGAVRMELLDSDLQNRIFTVYDPDDVHEWFTLQGLEFFQFMTAQMSGILTEAGERGRNGVTFKAELECEFPTDGPSFKVWIEEV